MPDRHRMEAGEADHAGLHRTIHDGSAHRIHPVENDETQTLFRGRFHGQAHGGDVGIKAATRVLDVEDQGVESRHLFGERLPGFPIEAVDGQAGSRVFPIDDFLLIEIPADAVFRAENGHKFHPRSLGQQVDRGNPLAAEAGVIGDEADLEARERREVLLNEDVDPILHSQNGRAASVATLATIRRSGLTLPPEGWFRLVSRMTKSSRGGSIQIEVPVQPVWP